MNRVSELSRIIGNELSWHKSRLECFTQLLLALFQVKTVNMRELAVAMDGPSQVDSRTKRLYRFFGFFQFSFLELSAWLLTMFFSNHEKFYIAIDRTNWYWGKKPINIFMLSICYEGIAIPILWRVLNKEGTSSGREQQSLVARFVKYFGQSRISGVLGDREFANKTFIRWLTEQEIPFYIRIKSNTMVSLNGKKYKPVQHLFSNLNAYEHRSYGMKVELFGAKYIVSASRNEQGELMIVLTNADHKIAIPAYLRRWEIESLFQSLKSRGFRFEETHVTEPKRIERMIALLAIGFAWAHKTGEWLAKKRPIPMKKIKKQRRPQYSFFRYGLDYIRDSLTGLKFNKKSLKKCLLVLIHDDFNSVSP